MKLYHSVISSLIFDKTIALGVCQILLNVIELLYKVRDKMGNKLLHYYYMKICHLTYIQALNLFF